MGRNAQYFDESDNTEMVYNDVISICRKTIQEYIDSSELTQGEMEYLYDLLSGSAEGDLAMAIGGEINWP